MEGTLENENYYIICSDLYVLSTCARYSVLQLCDFPSLLFFLAAGKRTHIAVGQERRTATRELRKLNFILFHPFYSTVSNIERRKKERNSASKCNNIFSPLDIRSSSNPPCLSNIYFRLHLASTNYAIKVRERFFLERSKFSFASCSSTCNGFTTWIIDDRESGKTWLQ